MKTVLRYMWAPFANLLWYLYTAVMGAIALTLSLFDTTGAIVHWCERTWSRLICRTIGARIRVSGRENIRAGRTYVFMANHSSLIDIPALILAVPGQFRIMAKKELFRIPFWGWCLKRAGHFSIDRSNPKETARSLRKVVAGVRAGKSLALFPEGTRSADGKLLRFKPGAFKLAMRAGVEIVPVTICGASELLPRGSLAPRPGRVDVIIGKPISASACDDNLSELMERTRRIIASNLEGRHLEGERAARLTAQSTGR